MRVFHGKVKDGRGKTTRVAKQHSASLVAPDAELLKHTLGAFQAWQYWSVWELKACHVRDLEAAIRVEKLGDIQNAP